MRAAVITAPGMVAIETVADPEPGPRDVVVRVLAAGVCGTDLHILDGEFAPRLPIVPGHELSGEVVAVGSEISSEVDRLRVGDRVVVDPSLPCHGCHYCRRGRVNLCENFAAIGVTRAGGAAEYAVVPQQSCILLPEDMDAVHAALTEPVACAVNAFDSLPRRPGEHYLLYGAGTMGLIMARLALRSGAAGLWMVEPRAERRKVAEHLGLQAVAPGDPAIEAHERGHDVVIDCTGVLAAIADGLPRVSPGGTFLHLGVPPEGARVDYDAHRVYRQEITITGTMSVQHSMERACDLLSAGLIDASALVSSHFSLEDYAAALGSVRDGQGIKSMVLPQG